jgi:ABC-type multidrug transport system fused ATPase/permease subunit
MKERISL